jgi:phage terminase small subunit
MNLTGKQKMFVEAYLQNGGNATAAAVTAGYSKATAYSQGGRLLKHVEVSTEIKRRSQHVVQQTQQAIAAVESATDRIVRERNRIAFADARRFFHPDGSPKGIHELSDDEAAVVAAWDVTDTGAKIKLVSKDASLAALERINRMYDDGADQRGIFNLQVNIITRPQS